MLSKNLENAISKALTIAKNFSHEYATIEHLFLALTYDPNVQSVLANCDIVVKEIQDELYVLMHNDFATLVVENLQESKATAGFLRVIYRALALQHWW